MNALLDTFLDLCLYYFEGLIEQEQYDVIFDKFFEKFLLAIYEKNFYEKITVKFSNDIEVL